MISLQNISYRISHTSPWKCEQYCDETLEILLSNLQCAHLHCTGYEYMISEKQERKINCFSFLCRSTLVWHVYMDRKKILKGVYSDVWKEAGTVMTLCLHRPSLWKNSSAQRVHHPFIRSWRTRSLTVALKWCSSDSLFKVSKASKCTILKRLRDSDCLNFWGGIAKIKSEGSPSKAYACASAGCLVEELRPLTTQWLFPKLSKTPPWVLRWEWFTR